MSVTTTTHYMPNFGHHWGSSSLRAPEVWGDAARTFAATITFYIVFVYCKARIALILQLRFPPPHHQTFFFVYYARQTVIGHHHHYTNDYGSFVSVVAAANDNTIAVETSAADFPFFFFCQGAYYPPALIARDCTFRNGGDAKNPSRTRV